MTSERKPRPGETAVRSHAAAERQRALARTMREEWDDPTGARLTEREADVLDVRATEALDPLSHTTGRLVVGCGGELIAPTAENLSRKPGLVDTVRERPDMLAADASLQRLDLAENVGVLALATDAAETIQAQNSLEKMLAHQMAATHSVGMKMLAKADQFLTACKDWQPAGSQQMQIVEAARLTAAAARLLDSYQRAALTVERLRNGGKQTVVVQHVAVSEGGQAIVAGSMPVPGGRKRRGRGAK